MERVLLWVLGLGLAAGCCTHAGPVTRTPVATDHARCLIPVRDAMLHPPACLAIGDSEIARWVATRFEQQVRERDPKLRVTISFECSPTAPELRALSTLRAHDHGTGLVLVRLELATGGVARVRLLQFPARDDTHRFDVFEQTVPLEIAERILTIARLAIAAKIDAAPPPPTESEIFISAMTGTSIATFTAVAVSDRQGGRANAVHLSAALQSVGENEPTLDLVWDELSPLLDVDLAPTTMTDADGALITELWQMPAKRPAWVEARLQDAAFHAGLCAAANSASVPAREPKQRR